jgi:hypothetical protein
MLAAVDDQAAPTVWPHWLVPPPRGSDGHAEVAADVQRQRHVVGTVAGTKTPTGMTW